MVLVRPFVIGSSMRVFTRKFIGYAVAGALSFGLAAAPAQAAQPDQPDQSSQTPSHGEIAEYAKAHPELGRPTRTERSIRGGATQSFEHGDVHWSPTTGTHWTHGGMNAYWAARKWENGYLGYPTSDERPVNGGTEQDFQRAVLVWRRQTGAVHAVRGSIRSRYAHENGADGWLGFPVSEERHLRKNGGYSQSFEHGQVHWSSGSGAHATRGGIQSFWSSRGWENGFLGYPTGDELQVRGGASQTFQGGTLFWNGKNGNVHSVQQPLLDQYGRRHYEQGDLGFPTGERQAFKEGVRQSFEHGNLEWKGCKLGWQNPGWAFQVCSHKQVSDWRVPQSSLSVTDSRNQAVAHVIDRAYQYLNTPYVWDAAWLPGTGRNSGVDCAGLVMQSLYADGMNLGGYNPNDHWATGPNGYHSHDANNMSGDSHFMPVSLQHMKPGDLVFYPGHVAIYIGGTSIIEAVPPRVRINHNLWYRRPTGARRPLI